MTAANLVEDMKTEFSANRRKFAPGVLIAFIRFFRELNALDKRYGNFDEFKRDYPIQTTSQRGGRANTLIVLREATGDRVATLSIRPFYNEIETFFRAVHKRFDYPNAAPHATQSWQDYVRWMDALLQMSGKDVESVERQTIDFVLASLPSHEIDAATLTPIRRRFSRLLQDFDMSAKKRRTARRKFPRSRVRLHSRRFAASPPRRRQGGGGEQAAKSRGRRRWLARRAADPVGRG